MADIKMETLGGFASPFGPTPPHPPHSLCSASPYLPAMVRRRRGRARERAGWAGWVVRPEGRRAPHAIYRLHRSRPVGAMALGASPSSEASVRVKASKRSGPVTSVPAGMQPGARR